MLTKEESYGLTVQFLNIKCTIMSTYTNMLHHTGPPEQIAVSNML